MTKAEAAKLVGIIIMAYPNFDKFKDEGSVRATIDLWAMMFADDDAGAVALATKKHIATSKWPPSIAEIRELMLEFQAPDLIPPEQAWLAVADYLEVEGEFGGYQYKSALPPLIDRVVKSIGYHNLYSLKCGRSRGEKAAGAKLTFLGLYTPLYEQERRRAMTPLNVTQTIDSEARRNSGGERTKIEDLRRQRQAAEKDAYNLTFKAYSQHALRGEEKYLEGESHK